MVSLRIAFSLPVVAALMYPAVGGYAAEAAPEKASFAWITDVDTGWRIARENQRPLLLFLSMDGCSHCQKMKRTTLKDKAVQHDLQAAFVSVSVNSKDAPELVKLLKVRYYPTTVVIQPTGEVIESIQGYQTATQLRKRLNTTLRQAAVRDGRVRR